MCDHALSTVRVVRLAGTTLGEKLITTKHWITEMYTGSLPCACSQYPEFSSQERHGHSFIPSWQYTGFGKGHKATVTFQSTMKSVLTPTNRPGSIACAIRDAWRRSLHDVFMPKIRDLEAEHQRHTQCDGHFSIDFVQRVAAFLRMLVVMGIDECVS